MMPVTENGKGHILERQHNLSYTHYINTISQPKDASDLTEQTKDREKIIKGCNRKLLTSSWTNFQFLTLSLLLLIMLLSTTVEVDGSPYIMTNCILNPALAVDPEEA